jgi:hypothetical protein
MVLVLNISVKLISKRFMRKYGVAQWQQIKQSLLMWKT